MARMVAHALWRAAIFPGDLRSKNHPTSEIRLKRTQKHLKLTDSTVTSLVARSQTFDP